MDAQMQQDSSNDLKVQNRAYAPPRRFVFDIHLPESTSAQPNENPDSQRAMKILHKCLPKLPDFIPPFNYKEAYLSLCESISTAYMEIRDLILGGYIEGILEVIKGLKIEGPGDCIKIMKAIIVKCHNKAKESNEKGDSEKVVSEYEKLVQQSEFKVRELIRIYRLNFDQLVAKNEESERIIMEMNEKIAENKALIESLMKETAKMNSTLRHKEEEIRNLRHECQVAQNHQQEIPVHTTESPVSEHRKGKTLSCNSQNLRMLLSDNRLTPTEVSGRILTTLKKTPTSTKTKAIPKQTTVLDLTSMASKNLKLNGLEKIKDSRETVKSQAMALTERRKNGSGTPGLSHSGRAGDYFNFFSSARGTTTHQTTRAVTPDHMNSRQMARSKGRKESGEDKSSSPLPIRAKHHDDFTTVLIKTDSYEENPKSSALLEKIERQKVSEYERKTSLKMDTPQPPTSNQRRRSGVTRTRPLAGDVTINLQKSVEHRANLSNGKVGGSNAASHRSVSKSKSIVFETKSNKGTKSNGPFMNIMLKKFTEQELNSKKIL